MCNEIKKDNVEEFLKIMKNQNIDNGFVLAFYTNEKISIESYEKFENRFDDDKINHLLELRFYNKSKELKIWRNSIIEEFTFRVLDENDERDSFIEKQFLDIDNKKTTKSNDFTKLTSTGGGQYTIDSSVDCNNGVLNIINYIKYTQEGLAKIVDYRILGIEGGGSNVK
ncbi:MAG TPA: hypothetical protein DCL29_05105 [Eubacterium sp.]|nr:hypothetical protein [Eubacterium sp.]